MDKINRLIYIYLSSFFNLLSSMLLVYLHLSMSQSFNIKQFQEAIIFENEHILAINKPAFVSSIDERQGEAPSILSIARKLYPFITVCHRLDKETSGVMLLAKDAETYREVSIAFEKRKVEKIYHAVIPGPTNYKEHLVDLPLRETKKNVMVIDRTGKDASTVFTTIHNFRHFSLVECKPKTGRMHQIRIHLSASNTPIVGDVLYGGKKPFLSYVKKKYKQTKLEEERPMFDRVALHAREISFQLFEETHHFIAEYPNDLEVFLKLLYKYDAN